MNQRLWHRMYRISLAIILGAVTVGALAWWATSARVTLADNSPLSGSVKTVTPSIVQPGDLVTYTIILSNSNTVSDVNVLLTDPLYPLLSYVPGSASVIPDGSGVLISNTAGITWSVTVSSAMFVTLTFQAQVSENVYGSAVTNTATISDSSGVIERSAAVTVEHVVYFPIIFRHWPPVPTLHEIDDSDGDGSYVVQWTCDDCSSTVVTYTLQEDTDPNFASPSYYYPGTVTEQAINGKIDGSTYYYRVRAHNSSWGSGPWSNVRSVVAPFHDDFNDPGTGWATRRTSSPDLNLIQASYSGGKLETRIDDRFDFGIFSPMSRAPVTPYSIRMRSRIVHQANETTYGIVFGGNSGTPCPVNRGNSGDENGCFFHYYRLNVLWGGYLKYQVKRIDYHEGDKGKAKGIELLPWAYIDGIDPNGWNDLEIRVYDNGFAVYMNDHLLGWTYDATYVQEDYYGIFGSTGEYNSSVWEHEYFYVDQLPAGSTLPSSGYVVPGSVNWYRPELEIDQTGQIE